MLNWLPEAASSYAADFDRLLSTVNWIVGIWFLLAEAVLIYLVIRYRRRPGRRAAYLPATTLRSMSFVLVPCAVILGFDLFLDGVSAPVWDEIKLTLPPHDEQVRIQGEQWAWRITYPGPDDQFDTADDIETINDLRVPNDKVILFELTAKDVLHSFWVPELRLKQDAVPGRTIRGWFRPTREGEFDVICAEICGLAHSMMKGSLRVESAQEYDRWLASKAAEQRRG